MTEYTFTKGDKGTVLLSHKVRIMKWFIPYNPTAKDRDITGEGIYSDIQRSIDKSNARKEKRKARKALKAAKREQSELK